MPVDTQDPRETKKDTQRVSFLFGGDKRDRTADLLTASQALSQLSYTPKPFVPNQNIVSIAKRPMVVNIYFWVCRKKFYRGMASPQLLSLRN